VSVSAALSDPSEHPPSLDIEPELLAHVRACIDDIRAGKMIVLVDDEDRENEGDLVFAAERVTAAHINFMAKHGRGLICLSLTEQQIERLELPMMGSRRARPGPALGTAFTLSIEARDGVTTGISAADRAHTIAVAIDEASTAEHIVTPGHVFPLKARPGGVLVRTGQTEGSVDLARLSGLKPAGVICEIMNDDGSMARLPDLERFAKEHDLRILTIADLVRYRLQTERLVRRVSETSLVLDQTGHGWRAVVYDAPVTQGQFLALVYGTPDPERALCRVHRGSTVGDLFSSTTSEGGQNLREAIERIESEGAGVVVYIPGHGDLVTELARFSDGEPAPDSSAGEAAPEGLSRRRSGPLREFGLGAQVLRELGLRGIRILTNNPKKIVGLRGFGLAVRETLPLGA
jgi:3,4-dihydroxy 2-butanone 4-phosphate synthase/GTP cyclohydrolase II